MPNDKPNRKPLNWTRLDNAAKIFPPNAHGADTGVFRLSCELTEAVEPDLLQRALDDTLKRFPHMSMVLRRGVFWHYLEQTTRQQTVVPEHAPPCAPLYEDSQSQLFEVSYWRNKVNIDVFHVLADGAGGIAFFQALLTGYLSLRHPEAAVHAAPHRPIGLCKEDGFQRYYKSRDAKDVHDAPRAYQLRGAHRDAGDLSILEGVAEVRQVLDAAHRYQTTLTVYLTAVLFCAIHEGMYVRHEKHPVVLTVPVDLRGYFPTDTARNFFSTIRVGYNFRQSGAEFSDVIAATAAAFRAELTPERLAARMNKLSALEHNPIIRPIPLALKNTILRISSGIADLGETAALSNVGRFQMPELLCPFVRGFGVFMATGALQLCTCTFGNSLHFGFTSAFESTDVQRRFFTYLTREGIAVEVRSNEYYEEDEAECSNALTAT